MISPDHDKSISNTSNIQDGGSIINYRGTAITEVIPNGFFTVDQSWTVKYWNLAAEKITGVPTKDIIGENLWEKLDAWLPAKFFEVCRKAFSGDSPVHFEEYWGDMGCWSNVIAYHCDNTLSVSFKDANRPVKPENVEKQLKALNELYRFVTEISSDCLWEWDLQNKEMFWIDGGHKRVFGYQIENALIPQNFWESLVHPDDRERTLKKLNKITLETKGSVWESEYRFKRADGNYAYVRDRAHIIYDKDRVASRMVGATQDISSRKLVEIKLVEERLAAQKELTSAIFIAQQKERVAIGKTLHENLSQILCAAKLYVELAKTNEDERAICLMKSSEYIVEVIEEIRGIYKLLGSPGIILELFESIQALVNGLNSINPTKIDFQHYAIYEEDLDENLQLDMFRIIQEQLNNVLQYSKASYAIINLTRHSNEATLLISDNGIGCDMHKVKMGAGIINIMTRAESYHGSVVINSKPGEGYELKVTLPLYAREKELVHQLSDYNDAE